MRGAAREWARADIANLAELCREHDARLHGRPPQQGGVGGLCIENRLRFLKHDEIDPGEGEWIVPPPEQACTAGRCNKRQSRGERLTTRNAWRIDRVAHHALLQAMWHRYVQRVLDLRLEFKRFREKDAACRTALRMAERLGVEPARIDHRRTSEFEAVHAVRGSLGVPVAPPSAPSWRRNAWRARVSRVITAPSLAPSTCAISAQVKPPRTCSSSASRESSASSWSACSMSSARPGSGSYPASSAPASLCVCGTRVAARRCSRCTMVNSQDLSARSSRSAGHARQARSSDSWTMSSACQRLRHSQ